GVPEMRPLPSVRPGGRPLPTPATTVQVAPTAGDPVTGFKLVTICASSCAEYGLPIVAFCGTELVTMRRPALMTMVKSRCVDSCTNRHVEPIVTYGPQGGLAPETMHEESSGQASPPSM